ncbi:Eco57I restriction-modification methylase domain-containing protein [Lamprocystis purpurea]|uniref:Eco57I restriction-modification methylase domain-containing protein n=1 Tax=Lamprocystis purpurea TaxID=61598 RepID=UPI0003750D8D|nr:N-6 DNA methylase [Lamprocystis purpurea]
MGQCTNQKQDSAVRPLEKSFRIHLERTVKSARGVAEAAARAALEQLGVGEAAPPAYLDELSRALRRRLRAHGRQLGDALNGGKAQTIDHLVQEVAYQHWHRMLFARFLADNNLLMYDGVAVTLPECDELASDEGAKSGWELAGTLAASMLPQIFRPDSPVYELSLPQEHQHKLETLLVNLPPAIFLASDSLGWVYQFWQADTKDQINKSGVKIGADELPSVTQLFTEDYMVDFLLDNTMGAWHAGKVLAANPTLAENAQSEDELRQAVALPGCPWSYLRFVARPCVARPSRSGSAFSEEPDRDGLATTGLSTTGLDPSSLVIASGENLPHWTCDQAVYHVSFRLADSVPQAKREEWIAERERLAENAKRANRELTAEEEDRIRFLYSERIEKFLDTGHGDCLMNHPPIAELVAGALRHFDGQRYSLHAWCVMPNHVHVIVEPLPGHDLSNIIHSWKSFTAHEINKRLQRRGDVWQHDAYNHIIRSEKEYRFQIAYVWENPDKAGLTDWVARAVVARPSVARPSRSGEVTRPSRSEELTRASRSDSEEENQTGTVWLPACTFDGWPKTAKELKCLDPCMGSGHFVVAMFERLVALRLAEENLDEASAVATVIRDNLFGLEIDPRCTQLAAFNLALAAWRRVGHCKLPAMNLACSGLAPNTREADWLAMAGDDEQLRNGMERLYRLFQKAAMLGSLINPRASEGDLLEAGFHELQPLLEKALAQEAADDTAYEMAVTARGVAKAAEILAGQFTLVATNVPYLVSGKQSDSLKDFLVAHFYSGRSDLATAFVLRTVQFCSKGGTAALVTPQNWLFLGSHRNLREELLAKAKWEAVVRLGAGAFETITGEVVNVGLVSFSETLPSKSSSFLGVDVTGQDSVAGKELALRSDPIAHFAQLAQLENPDARVLFEEAGKLKLLSDYVVCHQGLATGDLPRSGARFWEIPRFDPAWIPWQGTVDSTCDHGGRSGALLWEGGFGQLHAFNEAHKAVRKNTHLRGVHVVGKSAVVIAQMGRLPATLYSGERYDDNMTVLMPNDSAILPAIWAYCSSKEYGKVVRQRDQSLKVPANTLAKVPFDLAHWQTVAAEKYPHGLPKPFSSDPTQWLFDGNVARASRSGSDNDPDRDGLATLQVAVARLLGYQWPRQTGSSFPDCPALGPDGLERHADQDGIVCIPPVGREASASDRLLNLLAAAYGEAWINETLSQLLAGADHAGKSLETWLRDKFFIQHCKLFHNRPFIWHIWDGLRDGFSTLINYHKLDYKALESLIYTYLGDWISRQKQDIASHVDGAQERLAAAEALKKKLELILAGEAPYDIFVRWKPLEQHPLGWHPDLNDGVRMNIRPFLTVPDVGKRGAGVLRDKPNIKWEKDRGSDVPSAPWYELGLHYGGKAGDRINDHHLTLAEKRAARDVP